MNEFKTFTLLAILSTLLIGISYWAIGGNSGIILGLSIVAPINFIIWFYSDKIALFSFGAEIPNSEQAGRLQPMLEKLSESAQLPTPQIYVIPTDVANAFATGRTPSCAAIAVTDGLLKLLNPEELEAVLAHEISHIKHRDTLTQMVATTIAGAVSILAQMLKQNPTPSKRHSGVNPMIMVMTIIFAPFTASIIKLAISRTREFAADAGAAGLTGNPRALASALQRLETNARKASFSGNPAFAPLFIVNSFSGELLRDLFSTHPSTDARISALLNLESEVVLEDEIMENTNIPKNQAAEVFEKASRQYDGECENYSLEELIQAGVEAQIPPEAVKQAVKDLQTKQRQQGLQKIQRQETIKRGLAIIGTTVIVSMIWLGWTNNSLNHAAITVDAKWAQVENQMQRRADLIPNLTNITQAYTEHELDVIRSLTQARLEYLEAVSPQEKVAANTSMLRAIEQFTTFAIANPKLKSSELFINLQYEIAGTENRIATERRRYNQAVSGYNQSLSSFPTMLIAKPLGFQPKSFFQANYSKK